MLQRWNDFCISTTIMGHICCILKDQIQEDKRSDWKEYKGAFTPNVKSVLSESLGGILGGTRC
jgi:hypothetical protein